MHIFQIPHVDQLEPSLHILKHSTQPHENNSFIGKSKEESIDTKGIFEPFLPSKVSSIEILTFKPTSQLYIHEKPRVISLSNPLFMV
jgi:hypothetical protein